MSSVTNWIIETNWSTLFVGADLDSLPSGSAVASSNGAIANGTQLALYVDISVVLTTASGTPAAGSWMAIWLAVLGEDGSTYGDGNFPAGTQKAFQPAWQPAGIIPLNNAAGAQTKLAGTLQGILMPPGSWLPIFGTGGSAPTLSATSANNVVKYRTYNINLNGA